MCIRVEIDPLSFYESKMTVSIELSGIIDQVFFVL